MKTPNEILEQNGKESLKEKQSFEQWLEWLETLGDELDMRIESVKHDIRNK